MTDFTKSSTVWSQCSSLKCKAYFQANSTVIYAQVEISITGRVSLCTCLINIYQVYDVGGTTTNVMLNKPHFSCSWRKTWFLKYHYFLKQTNIKNLQTIKRCQWKYINATIPYHSFEPHIHPINSSINISCL